MKKQILILMVAIFAISFTTAFGQAVNNPTISPVPLTCPTNDPLNPIAGRPYDYLAVINPTGGNAFWYATKSTTFTTGGVRVATEIPADGVAIANTALNYRTLATSPTSPTSTQVTWTSAGLAGVTLANPLFMVVEYAGPTCSNNMKVMKIVPKIAFTVDITNIDSTTAATLGYGAVEEQCFDKVASSSYDLANDNITIDYGSNTMFFEVVAANFTGSYTPSFQLTGLQGTQTADIAWGYVKGTYDQVLGTAVTGSPYTALGAPVSTSLTDTQNGVSIYVRVIVHNHGFEGLSDAPVALAVEAVDANANADVEPDCTTILAYGDIATQTLKTRPTITPGTPMLLQKN
ncbi:MAG: hypothetical protein D4R97_08855 [Bacteroidetes bacterium]|nr:MAG: hypothetical protein D4R97_08855 [Bacteroidota bacterium]